MRSLLLVPFLGAAVFAADTQFDVTNALTQIGIGVLIAAPTFWWARREARRNESLEQTVAGLQRAAVDRERELGDRALLLLHDAAEALKQTQESMASSMETLRAVPSEMDLTLRRLELALDEARDLRAGRRTDEQ